MRQFYFVKEKWDTRRNIYQMARGWAVYAEAYDYLPDHSVFYRGAGARIVLVCLPSRKRRAGKDGGK